MVDGRNSVVEDFKKDLVDALPYKTDYIESLVLKLETNEYSINNMVPELF